MMEFKLAEINLFINLWPLSNYLLLWPICGNTKVDIDVNAQLKQKLKLRFARSFSEYEHQKSIVFVLYLNI